MHAGMTPMLASAGEGSGGAHGPFLDVLIILAASAITAIIARRLRIDTIPAYLLAGAVIGPYTLGLVPGGERLETVSSVSTILLMFGIGLQMDITTLRSSLSVMLSGGVGATVLAALVGWPVAMLFGLSAPAALAVTLALAISSTAVLLRMLQARREMKRPSGRLSLLISVVQDLVSLGVLIAIPMLAQWAGAGASSQGDGGPMQTPLGNFLVSAALKIGAVTGIIVTGRLVIPRLLRAAGGGGGNEAPMVLSTAAAIGAAIGASAVGFSPELGAFLAGLMLSGSQFRHQIAGQIIPLRDLLLALFFTVVGMKVDPIMVASSWWIILLGLTVMLIIKSVVIASTCWSIGAAPATSVVVGVTLAMASEFSLVLLDVAHKTPVAGGEGLISSATLGIGTAIVALSLLAAPVLFHVGDRLRPRALRLPPAPWIRVSQMTELVEKSEHAEGRQSEHTPLLLNHVVLAGYGVVGRAIADRLDAMGARYTIIEFNPTTVNTQTRLGRSIVFGDASNPEVLESAGIRHADAVILTMPDEDAVLRACQTVRQCNPTAFIAARTNYLSKGMAATRLGADHVTIEEIATAEAMAWEVTRQLTERAIGSQVSVTPPKGA